MSPSAPGPAPLRWSLAALVWAGFAVLAVAAGVLRILVLAPWLGERLANLGETLALVLTLAGLQWIAVPWIYPELEERQTWVLGGFWLGLTVAFEFVFGHFVSGASWSALLANYDITAGRLWILVPLTMGLGPHLVRAIRLGSGALPRHRIS
jgi:hypothetical protein